MKQLFFALLLCTTLHPSAQVAVNLPTGQPIDPLAALQVCGTTRIDSLPDAPMPTHIVVLDQNDSILHKLSLASFVSLISSTVTTVPIIHTYTLNTVWNKPPNLKYIVVEMVGGGGGGGGCNNYGGGAGAAGGYCKKIIPANSLGATESIIIGNGGAGGIPQYPGEDGGTTSFGSHCLATGGEGGKAQTTTVFSSIGSSGGIGIGGDVNIVGSGSGGVVGAGNALAIGGSSFSGGSTKSLGNQINSDGFNAVGYGSGGGGGNGYNTPNRSGGAGGAGIIIITEYY